MAIVLTVLATLTWYNPNLGGMNCDRSCAHMAAGHRVEDWWGRALACPQEFPLGTVFEIRGSRWGLADGDFICLDRGGGVTVLQDGTVVLDLLRTSPIWQESLIVTAYIPPAVWEQHGGEVYLELVRIPPLSLRLLGPPTLIRRDGERLAV